MLKTIFRHLKQLSVLIITCNNSERAGISGTNSKREKDIKAELAETEMNPARLPWFVSGMCMCNFCVEVTGQPWVLVLLETGSLLILCTPV